jgi:hypothetical protein
MVIRTSYLSRYFQTNIEKGSFRSHKGYIHPNLFALDRNTNQLILRDYENLISKIPHPQERAYQMAMQLKRKAIFQHKYCFDRNLPQDTDLLESWLEEAYALYKRIDKNFLQEEVSVSIPYYNDGIRTPQMTRRHLLIYPDYMDGWFTDTYHSDLIFNFIVKRGLLSELYETGQDLQSLHYWIAKHFEIAPLGCHIC